jgi:hypothetical protein
MGALESLILPQDESMYMLTHHLLKAYMKKIVLRMPSTLKYHMPPRIISLSY